MVCLDRLEHAVEVDAERRQSGAIGFERRTTQQPKHVSFDRRSCEIKGAQHIGYGLAR